MMLNLNMTLEKVLAIRFISNAISRLKKTPAFLALMIQCIALLFVITCSRTIYHSASAQWNIDTGFFLLSLVILQSIIASSISYAFAMAVWWRWIHFFFPIALWVMSISHIPNTFYLVGFIVTLALYWTTFKTQVPFYPSSPNVWKALALLMGRHSHSNQSLHMIDIGSGIGDMSMYIAKTRKQDVVEGIEIAPLPWLISLLRAKLNGSRANFTLGNYHQLNFADFDVVFAYLSPAAMLQLWEKASKEMRTGSLLVSLEFEIPDVDYTEVIVTGKTSPKLFVWRM
jgi:hypothetical protein